LSKNFSKSFFLKNFSKSFFLKNFSKSFFLKIFSKSQKKFFLLFLFFFLPKNFWMSDFENQFFWF
jgi:hypothetical protein